MSSIFADHLIDRLGKLSGIDRVGKMLNESGSENWLTVFRFCQGAGLEGLVEERGQHCACKRRKKSVDAASTEHKAG